jgi:hypothetical protein
LAAQERVLTDPLWHDIEYVSGAAYRCSLWKTSPLIPFELATRMRLNRLAHQQQVCRRCN